MTFGQPILFHTMLRRCVALIALAGILYASTFAILPHAMASQARPDVVHAGMDHAAVGHSTADQGDMVHGGHVMAPAVMPAVADMPCDQGCVLCEDCAVCVMALLLPTGLPLTTSPYQPFHPLAERTPLGHLPALPAEPPRV